MALTTSKRRTCAKEHAGQGVGSVPEKDDRHKDEHMQSQDHLNPGLLPVHLSLSE